eukprot:CAMPEP_0116825452 /NCGR_PEP_ID=MMETSP0418-20121206/1974_1 /TAXON_ID=1158023 /ORGANISM="Astrosyne radiata, Strain 13vi08-1A" /LENGTH=129 /DNA_ID=CAMNT_0004453963 /DNA_START=440 /DNA_END=826 /DNA_ORIENTATION=+
MILYALTQTRAWNLVLMLHGLYINLFSNSASIGTFMPPNVDLINIIRSFVAVDASVERKRSNKKVEIIDSSIGMLVVLSVRVKVCHSSVCPLVQATEDFCNDRSSEPTSYPFWCLLARETSFVVQLAIW